jgi:Ca2+-transporting ATPase
MTLTHLYMRTPPHFVNLRSDIRLASDRLLRYAALCCDGKVVFQDGTAQHIGDPTETAIINGRPTITE